MSLSHNPIWQLPLYRRLIGTSIPQLRLLDGRKMSPDDKAALSDEQLEDAHDVLSKVTIER